jgi:hypothetical protein
MKGCHFNRVATNVGCIKSVIHSIKQGRRQIGHEVPRNLPNDVALEVAIYDVFSLVAYGSFVVVGDKTQAVISILSLGLLVSD